MKIIGIQIKSSTAILVVLEVDAEKNITQTNESIKFEIADVDSAVQVRQFRDQIFSAFDSIHAERIDLIARNAKAKGKMASSPVSFKLEGIIQLYEKLEVEIIWPQTVLAFLKKNPINQSAKHVYQQDAFNLAWYFIKKN